MHADFPLKDIACMLLAQTKDAKIVCFIGCREDADPHTVLNALLVLAMIERKLYSYQNACFKQKQSVKTKKRMMCPPGVLYIAVTPVVMSWAVAGQQVVFLYYKLQARVTLTTFPIATPRGRSSKFHEREQPQPTAYIFLFSYTIKHTMDIHHSCNCHF